MGAGPYAGPTPGGVRTPAAKVIGHSPLDDPKLFERFADLKLTRESIQQFANQYGNLFARYGGSATVCRPPGKYHISQLHGPSLRKWKAEVQRMRTLVTIWRAIKEQRKQDLEDVIVWKAEDTVGYKLTWTDDLIANPRYRKHLLDRFRPLDVFKPAMYLLHAEINKRLADPDADGYLPVFPRLEWCSGPQINGVARPDHHQRLVFGPANLLAAIWLQFARAVTEVRLQLCSGCDQYFQVGKGARRIHTKTCSVACRQRLSRADRSPAG